MDTITFDDFAKLDIRIGIVIKAEVTGVGSHWVIKLTVDFKTEEIARGSLDSSSRSGRQSKTIVVFAGMMKFYKPEDFEGKQFPFVVNIC